MAGRTPKKSKGTKTATRKKTKPARQTRATKTTSAAWQQDDDAAGLKARVVDSNALAIMVTDADLNLVYVNKAFQKMSGYGSAEVLGKHPRMLYSDKNAPELLKTMKNFPKEGHWQGEVWGVKKSGEESPVWIDIYALKNGKGRIMHYAATLFDITLFKQNEQRLEQMAHYDVLTNLPNRSLMYDRLDQAVRAAKRYRTMVAVMLLDIDRFKDVNDNLGHHIGDQLLVQASARLMGCIRDTDTIARMGGDEFLAILPEMGSAGNAAHIAQKFLDALSTPFELEGHEVFVSGSVGIAMYPNDSQDVNMLVKNADTSMYHAKAQGKNNFKFFTEEINKSTVERFRLESRFRRALEKLEFQLNYQPKVDFKTGRIKGMEALLRWYHPDQGHVNPSLFIPLAEETGFVVQLSEWALKEACRQNKEWQDQGLPLLRVSVNLSARHFHKKDLPEIVGSVLKETGLDPKHLMLEITEGTIIQKVDETIQTLKKFRKMGIGVSIDDFGTGYSSLNYLNRFDIDELKIDKSFVSDILNDFDSRKVIMAIVSLAHSLNLTVVAEGVETSEQYEFLKNEGCDELQGYFFSKPLSSEDFRKLVSQGLTIQKPVA
jgi:diguanylate cyclase (GGDEF)-like protein/PAS domain S-box-containing protein